MDCINSKFLLINKKSIPFILLAWKTYFPIQPKNMVLKLMSFMISKEVFMEEQVVKVLN